MCVGHTHTTFWRSYKKTELWGKEADPGQTVMSVQMDVRVHIYTAFIHEIVLTHVGRVHCALYVKTVQVIYRAR